MNTPFISIFKKLSSVCFLFFFILAPQDALGQFYLSGNDPGSVKWYYIKTQNYKIVYPEGLDSLAREYGNNLEKWRTPVGGSIGYKPSQQYRRQMPVILHAYNATANGSVVWAPRRMDLYTVMDAYESDPLPWVKELAIHESRHVSQMQFGKDGVMKIGHYLVGEMWEGALSAIYPNLAFMEGDAVVAETALTNSGRGRLADFLEYYRVAFDNSDFRSWYQWRYGSQKYYTPNHYTIGYLSIAGVRYLYDGSDFSKRYFERISHGFPIRFNNFQKTIKEYSHKNFKTSFGEISNAFHEVWEKEDRQRLAPISFTRVTSEASRYTTYLKSVIVDDDIYSVKSTLTASTSLVRISPEGKETFVRPFASSSSKLVYSNKTGRIYWSEGVVDARWDLAMTSRIAFLEKGSAKIHFLTDKGRFFNPSTNPQGDRLAVVNYPIEGGSEVVILDASDGSSKQTIPVPSELQVEETAWTNDGIFASMISEEGYGLYKYTGNGWTIVLKPQSTKIKNLQSFNSDIFFTCDITGVNELYSLIDGSLNQLTSSKYGASDFAIKDNIIYYAYLESSGKNLVKVPFAPVQENVEFKQHKYEIADKLTSQEKAIGSSESFSAAVFSEKKPYHKILNFAKIHSWAPIYFNYDEIENLSYNLTYDFAGLGATALFQNELSTIYGSIGYNYHKDPQNEDSYRHSAHLNLTYRGLYPVFNVIVDAGDRSPIQYGWRDVLNDDGSSKSSLSGKNLSGALLSGQILSYVPLTFNYGGWYRGVIPQLKYSFTNDWFNTSRVFVDNTGRFDMGGFGRFYGSVDGKNVLMQSLSASLRGYIIKPTPSSSIYPKLGVGVELGYSSRLGLSDVFNSGAYAFAYGYLPGIHQSHSIKLTAKYQHQIGDGFYRENTITTRPRGFAGSSLSRYLASYEKDQISASAEYAMPVLPVDWSFLCPFAYIRNFEIRPHFDYMHTSHGGLFSTGSAFNVHLGNFLWVPYDTTCGICISYNGGSAYNSLNSIVANLSRTYVEFVFNIDL